MIKKYRISFLIATAFAVASIITGCTSDTGAPGGGASNPLIGAWTRPTFMSSDPATETMKFNSDYTWSDHTVMNSAPHTERLSTGTYTVDTGAGTVSVTEKDLPSIYEYAISGDTLTLKPKNSGALSYTRVAE